MRIVAISDTHGLHPDIPLPPGDVLVHAGDITQQGDSASIQEFIRWFGAQHFKHKIFIAGNHDFWAQTDPAGTQAMARDAGVHYLCGSGVRIEGLNFWGSPWTPKFMDWAFMLADRVDAQNHWRLIPGNTNVLITHGPPHGVLDELDVGGSVPNNSKSARHEHVGCKDLRKRVEQLAMPLHIFGHIHEGYGIKRIGKTRFLNASQLDNRYKVANAPLLVELAADSKASAISSTTVAARELEA